MRTIQRSRFLFLLLVKKIALFHKLQARRVVRHPTNYELLYTSAGARLRNPAYAALRVHSLQASIRKRVEIRMARKKKAKRFRAVTAVKELARERVGAPPAGQVVVEKKKKPEKHKPTLRDLLQEGE